MEQEPTVQPDINESQMDDFAVDTSNYEIVDEDGNPTETIKTGLETETPPKGETVPPQAPVAPQAQPNAPVAPVVLVDPQAPVAPQAPVGLDADFATDGQYDGGKALNFLTQNNDYQFQRAFTPQLLSEEAPQPAEEKKPGQEIFEWHEQTKKSELGGLEEAYESLRALNQDTYSADQVRAAFDNAYITRKADIDQRMQSKNFEFIQESNKSFQQTNAEKQEEEKTKAMAKQNRNLVAGKVGGLDKFNALIFGTLAPDGKTVQSPGYGADVIDWMFEQQTDLTGLKTADDYQNAYASWWDKFSAKTGNLDMVVTLSKAKYTLQNQSKIRDAYRGQWDAEKGVQRAGITQPPQGRTVQPQNTADSIPADIRQAVGL